MTATMGQLEQACAEFDECLTAIHDGYRALGGIIVKWEGLLNTGEFKKFRDHVCNVRGMTRVRFKVLSRIGNGEINEAIMSVCGLDDHMISRIDSDTSADIINNIDVTVVTVDGQRLVKPASQVLHPEWARLLPRGFSKIASVDEQIKIIEDKRLRERRLKIKRVRSRIRSETRAVGDETYVDIQGSDCIKVVPRGSGAAFYFRDPDDPKRLIGTRLSFVKNFIKQYEDKQDS